MKDADAHQFPHSTARGGVCQYSASPTVIAMSFWRLGGFSRKPVRLGILWSQIHGALLAVSRVAVHHDGKVQLLILPHGLVEFSKCQEGNKVITTPCPSGFFSSTGVGQEGDTMVAQREHRFVF